MMASDFSSLFRGHEPTAFHRLCNSISRTAFFSRRSSKRAANSIRSSSPLHRTPTSSTYSCEQPKLTSFRLRRRCWKKPPKRRPSNHAGMVSQRSTRSKNLLSNPCSRIRCSLDNRSAMSHATSSSPLETDVPSHRSNRVRSCPEASLLPCCSPISLLLTSHLVRQRRHSGCPSRSIAEATRHLRLRLRFIAEAS